MKAIISHKGNIAICYT